MDDSPANAAGQKARPLLQQYQNGKARKSRLSTALGKANVEALILSAFKATVFIIIYETCLSWLLVLFVHAGIWNWLAFAYPGFLGFRDVSQGLELEQVGAWCPVLTYSSEGSRFVAFDTQSHLSHLGN